MMSLVMLMLPRYVPEGVPSLPISISATIPRRTYCDEESLLLVLTLSILTQLLLVAYVGFGILQPCSLRQRQLNEWHRRRFASFIFRRLLRNLDDVLAPGHPAGVQGIPATKRLEHCLWVSGQVDNAVQIFRRDALKVLHPCQDLSSHLAGDLYFVLEEEELELTSAGYGYTDANVNAGNHAAKVEVTEELLMSLLYPERAVVAE
ncbi:hypothetical protein KR018_008984 [Drosophila ironensis]|nr:hypothetical protein KR018_008984 [Drosophila ironensis]